MRAAAGAQGWRFEVAGSAPREVLRWEGQSEGVRWTMEYRRGWRRQNQRQRVSHQTVWWADTFHGPASPVLFIGVPVGKETPSVQLAQGEGMLASMARKAAGFMLDQAVDANFGEELGREVDARQLKLVEGLTVPGFMVAAIDAQQARWWLGNGGAGGLAALAQAAPARGVGHPWVMVMPRRVYLSRRSAVRNPADVGQWVGEGLALVRSRV